MSDYPELEVEGQPWQPGALAPTGWDGELRYRRPGDTHRFDALGRRQPRCFPLGTLLGTAVFTAAERTRPVPARAIAEQGEDDDGPFSMVDCPCGHHPVARSTIESCGGGCGRWYVMGAQVWVVYGEGIEPPKAAQSET